MSKSDEYKKLRLTGMTYSEIAAQYGVTRQAVCDGCLSERKGGGKHQRVLKALKFDKPICLNLEPKQMAGLRRAARAAGISLAAFTVK